MNRLGLTARGLDRLLRVARTIADLSDREAVRAGGSRGGPPVPALLPPIRPRRVNFKVLENDLDAPVTAMLASSDFLARPVLGGRAPTWGTQVREGGVPTARSG